MTALQQDDILSAVWRACDTFRGAVDATQYKDYVLTALFLKYISDVRRKHVEEFRRDTAATNFAFNAAWIASASSCRMVELKKQQDQ